MNQGANAYKKAAVTTATPGQVLIMLYEAAIRYVKKAADCIDKKDNAGKGVAIGKVHDIINELNTSLNFEVGGDIARNLERLYNFMVDQLVQANAKNSKENLMNVQKNLETLLEGWRGAIEKVNKGQT
jgi:flagellar protein FliS